MINQQQLRDLVVAPTLDWLDEEISHTEVAEDLLMATCVAESLGGTYLKQVGGPALGIYQMEPFTHNDIWKNYLAYKPDLFRRLLTLSGSPSPMEHPELMVSNLTYATAMARVHYYRVSEPLPKNSSLELLGQYWKDHYNTKAGAGTADHFVQMNIAANVK